MVTFVPQYHHSHSEPDRHRASPCLFSSSVRSVRLACSTCSLVKPTASCVPSCPILRRFQTDLQPSPTRVTLPTKPDEGSREHARKVAAGPAQIERVDTAADRGSAAQQPLDLRLLRNRCHTARPRYALSLCPAIRRITGRPAWADAVTARYGRPDFSVCRFSSHDQATQPPVSPPIASQTGVAISHRFHTADGRSLFLSESLPDPQRPFLFLNPLPELMLHQLSRPVEPQLVLKQPSHRTQQAQGA